jgi:hypothetical protein
MQPAIAPQHLCMQCSWEKKAQNLYFFPQGKDGNQVRIPRSNYPEWIMMMKEDIYNHANARRDVYF